MITCICGWKKRNCNTLHLIQQLAAKLQIKPGDIGYAGLKDRHATTRQWLSVSGISMRAIAGLDLGENITILEQAYHSNKLRPGHLRGNRFRINIHDVEPNSLERARDIIHVLELTGMPNIFGPQRYGVRGNNHLIGAAILRGEFDTAAQMIIGTPEEITQPHWHQAAAAFAAGDLGTAVRVMPRSMKDERRVLQTLHGGASAKKAVLNMSKKILRLYLSAYQSALFDRMVEMRLESLDLLWPGDIAYIHANGACFRVDEPQKEQARADSFEISPTGLLPGKKAMLASGQAGMLESALLEKENMPVENYTALRGLQLSAERRPLRVRAEQVECSMHDPTTLHVSFSLPAGSFATSFVREITKSL